MKMKLKMIDVLVKQANKEIGHGTILKTIDEYLQNRQNSGQNIEFNELIQYLNAFITCK